MTDSGFYASMVPTGGSGLIMDSAALPAGVSANYDSGCDGSEFRYT